METCTFQSEKYKFWWKNCNFWWINCSFCVERKLKISYTAGYQLYTSPPPLTRLVGGLQFQTGVSLRLVSLFLRKEAVRQVETPFYIAYHSIQSSYWGWQRIANGKIYYTFKIQFITNNQIRQFNYNTQNRHYPHISFYFTLRS